jgi:uncharacterized lipoprotein YddW (UPF0748 family)
VFLQHGLGQSGDADWLTHSPQGETKFPVGYFLDPGHPAAAAYLADIYLNIVRHYAVDGIHFDYIRYPETEARFPRGAAVGYNTTSLARFRHSIGRQDSLSLPEPDDPQWTVWRRQQVTQVVRRIYIEAKGINPKLKVSAAVIAWGRPPHSKRDFNETAPMQRIFQDWRAWLEEGILDLAVPMNYARERDPVVRSWFDGWIQWEAQNKNGRQLAVGLGTYLNPPESTLAQIERARHAGKKYHPDGVSLFSYFAPYAASVSPPGSSPTQVSTSVDTSSNRLSFLATGVVGNASSQGAFGVAASIPKMDWIEHPVKGWLAGFARQGAVPADGAVVELKRAGSWGRSQRTLADGSGFFGFSNLRPGTYHARVKTSHGRQSRVNVEIVAGRVTRVELVAP